MMTFDAIATALLRSYDYEPLLCDSDEEAIEKTEIVRHGGHEYPVHYSSSNTSGEKAYEEFYTEEESVDMERFCSLGVITNKVLINADDINQLFDHLEDLFTQNNASKEEVIEIIKKYLPNFEYVEKGKSLDSKM